MNEELNCPNGSDGCDFAENHELALAGRILRMIEGYTQDNRTYPCPKCLRNSIMAIAALLHIEAEKEEMNGSKPGCVKDMDAVETFAEAARERIVSVMDAVVDIDAMLGKRRLM
jgi:hypothetical protein